jgi:GAF domain-containing protein
MRTLTTLEQVGRQVDEAAARAASPTDLMRDIVQLLHQAIESYDWVGFYMIESGGNSGEPELVLGAFVGAPTPHTRIKLNQGICGAAASSGQTVLVDNVHADSRYLACSIETQSEIVAPVFANGTVVGELDIDSHSLAAFTAEDRALVEHCAALVGRALEKHRS